MPINGIKISGVRGIRKEISIILDGKSLLLHGDNGTGKSSIEKALRWALLGSEPPTDAEPFSDEISFRRNILEPAESVKVSIILQKAGRIEVTTTGSNIDAAGKQYQDSCCIGNPFLRRSEILSFLQSRPVDRFSYLEAFLDISHVDTLREAYSSEMEKCQGEMRTLSNRIETSLSILSAKLPEAARKQIIKVSALELACFSYAIQLSLIDQIKSYDWALLVSSKSRASTLSEGNKLELERTDLASVISEITSFISTYIEKDIADIGKFNLEVEKLKSSTTDAKIFDLLTHAQHHFSDSKTSTCPVCGNAVKREELLAQLSGRLSNLASFREVKAKLETAIPTWRTAISKFLALSDHVVKCLSLSDIIQVDESYTQPKGFGLLYDIDEQPDNEKLLTTIIAIGPSEISAWMKKIVEASNRKASEALTKLPPSSATGELRIFADLIDQFEKKRDSLSADESRLSALSRRLQVASAIAEALRRARQDVAKEILDSISDQVTGYYQRIHPTDDTNEATDAPSIKVQRHGKGTAFVHGVFAGKPIADPNWVYSDGHLDTVGICVFLALRRFRADCEGDARLLVLDDVVLSIDLAHARRLISLLKDCFSDHQIIILTHNGLFAHWCARMLPGMKRLIISSWSLEGGPRIGEYRTAIQNVELSMPDQSAKQIALQVMALMDEWLAECRYTYSLSVPAKYGEQYTITDIWNQFAKTITKLGKLMGNDLGGALSLVDFLSDLPAIRNALPAHENDFAKEFPRQTMVEIAQNTVKLVRSLYCIKCQSFCLAVPDRFNPVILHCDCQDIQYVKSKTIE